MWLFFQPADERARPWQSYVKVVDPEEQEEAVARLGVVGTCQRGMLVGAHSWRQSKTVPSESTICPK
jgi:DNA-directed RNA polymerase subunit N (RpoN/RPB10)